MLAALLTLSVACTAQSKKESGSSKAEIQHINANYMREHIYDFDAHPDTFVYKGTKPAIIDFYADWCRPCRQLAPKLQEVADRYADQLVVYKVNVDENPQLASLFGVQSIPMVLFVPLDDLPYGAHRGALEQNRSQDEQAIKHLIHSNYKITINYVYSKVSR